MTNTNEEKPTIKEGSKILYKKDGKEFIGLVKELFDYEVKLLSGVYVDYEDIIKVIEGIDFN